MERGLKLRRFPPWLTGWVSRAGNKLEFDDQGVATDVQSGEQYQLKHGVVRQVEYVNSPVESSIRMFRP